jgi:hypothetical protein
MLTAYVWAIEGPDNLTPCDTAGEAVAHVLEGRRVLLQDYQTAIRTLIMLGVEANRALYLANVARQQPQHQESYVAD